MATSLVSVGWAPPHADGSPAPASTMEPQRVAAESRLAMRLFQSTLVFLLVGYALFDKGFAYLHVPGTPIFAGEILVLLFGGVAVFATGAVRVATRGSWAFGVLLLFMVCGLFRALPYASTYGIDTARDSALWYYAVIAAGVAALCVAWPRLPEEWARRYAAVIPVLLLWSPAALALSKLSSPLVPGSPVSVFDHSPGNIAVQATIALSFLWLVPVAGLRLRHHRAITALGVLVLLLAGSQNRGGLVAATVGLGLCLVLGRHRLRMVGVILASITLLMVTAWSLDLHATGSQGRQISAAQVVTNIASVNNGNQGALGSTVAWRDQLWGAATRATLERGQLAAGWGFGPNVAQGVGFHGNENPPLRSPHNSHLDIFVRMGLIGAGLWVALWLTWFGAMFRARARLSGLDQRARRGLIEVAMVGVIATLVNAYFDPSLEGPQAAIWLWTLVGLGLGIAATTVTASRLPLSRD